MSPFNRALGNEILAFLCTASDNDVDPREKARITEFARKSYTDAELYDFLGSISQIQCDRVGTPWTKGYFCIGYISGFVQAVCDICGLYERPEDGGESAKLPEGLLEKWKRT